VPEAEKNEAFASASIRIIYHNSRQTQIVAAAVFFEHQPVLWLIFL
jgi:hypothetical protein